MSDTSSWLKNFIMLKRSHYRNVSTIGRDNDLEAHYLEATATAPKLYLWTMAKPDRPNFSLPARIIFGVVAIAVIVALLAFFGYIR